MLLVILGAGASYDSVSHFRAPAQSDDRPPLASELFENRPEFVKVMYRFGRCRQIVPFLRGQGVAIERELARIQSQADSFDDVHSELAAIRYYLRFAIRECVERWVRKHYGINNYVTMVREIARWRAESGEKVAFVTFNYDTMLETAVMQVLGFSVSDFLSYIRNPDYSVFKLHGSVNWARVIPVATPNSYTYDRVINEALSLGRGMTSEFAIVDHAEMLNDGRGVLFPALALPVDRKDEFSCPTEHIAALANVIPQITKISIIGWRATEEKLLNMLRSRLTGLSGSAELMIVAESRKSALDTFENLGVHDKIANWTTFDDGFSGLALNGFEPMNDFLRSKKPAGSGGGLAATTEDAI